MANKIVKQRRGLLVLGIIALVLFAGALTGAIILLLGCQKVYGVDWTSFGLQLGWGIFLAILCAFLFFWGIYAVWVSTAIKADKGSIADPAIVKGTVNGKKCPKCGCTNTPDATKCENCGEPLE